MTENQFVASIHNDYLPFVEHATDEELAQFIRAQIRQSNGEEVPELTGMAKALFKTHMALVARLENSKKKKSEAGKLGGNPHLKQSEAVVKQCLSDDKAVVKPNTVTNTVTNTITITNNEDLEANASCAEPSDEPDAPHREAVITLTLNDKSEYPIYENSVQEWSELYPAVDVMQQLRSMRGWIKANPTKRKTERGILKFINGWLSREQNSGKSPPKSSPTGNGFTEILTRGEFDDTG